MKFHTDLVQGSPEWLELRANYFTASEAAAMLGLSKYQTRSQLLHQKATGETEEVTPAKQKLFDKGHAAEESARVIVERGLEEELYPTTISNEVDGLPLLASMDGLTMLGDKGWEHKLWNKELANYILGGDVPDTHWPQLEHQLLVCGANIIHFTVSDGTEDNMEGVIYQSKPERRKQLIAGWKQFQEDLANYVPEAKAEVVEAEPVKDLPALRYTMDGLSLSSNLAQFEQEAKAQIEEASKPLECDQDFANAESRQKIFTKAEKACDEICDRALGEIGSIDDFVKSVRHLKEQMRQARLAEGKQIKARKDEIRAEIMSQANADIIAAKNEAENKINANLPALSVNIANAMKGKRTIDSLKDAAAGEVAQAKIEINEFVELAMGNALCLSTQGQGYEFLFNDWQQIAFKATDDFKALVKSRIADHKEREAKREEEQRARIRAEEEAKAKREAEAKLRAEEAAKRKAEQERQAAEQAAKREQEMREQQASATKAQAEVDKQSKQEVTANEAPEVESEPEAKPAQYLGHPNSKKPDTAKRKLSMMEINGIINFVSSITSSEETPFSEELQRRADDYIQQHSSEAA